MPTNPAFKLHIKQNPASTPPSGTLLYENDLTYLGAFKLPLSGPLLGYYLQYVGRGLAYRSGTPGTLIMGYHIYTNAAMEVSIPTLVVSTNQADLNTATLVQNPAEITEGAFASIDLVDTSIYVGGYLVSGSNLLQTAYVYYDGDGNATKSHFKKTSLTLSSTGNVTGPFASNFAGGAGFVAGALADVPSAWQSALGGPVMCGQGSIGVVSRTSYGPSLWTFNPSTLAAGFTVNGLCYYPNSHQNLGAWDGNGTFWHGADEFTGIVFPTGYDSVLCFGTHGSGAFHYGAGTSNIALDGTPVGDGDYYWYDPAHSGGGDKGTHAYPYHRYIWAYNANDLALVKAGSMNPWDVYPYVAWDLDALPFDYTGDGMLRGAAYDATHKKIYITQYWGYGDVQPVVHCLSHP